MANIVRKTHSFHYHDKYRPGIVLNPGTQSLYSRSLRAPPSIRTRKSNNTSKIMNKLTKPRKKPLPKDDEYYTAPTRRLTVRGGRVVPKEVAERSAVQMPSASQASDKPRPSNRGSSRSPAPARSNTPAPSSRYSRIPSDCGDMTHTSFATRSDDITAKEVADLEHNLSE